MVRSARSTFCKAAPRTSRRIVLALLTLLFSLSMFGAVHAETFEVDVDAQTRISVERLSAAGDKLLLILPSEHGLQPAHSELASKLARTGLETWIADPLAAYFLNATPSGIDAVPSDAIAALIERATRTGKVVYFFANDRGAALTLRGVHLWQDQHPQSTRIGGAIFLSPFLHTQTPEAGQTPQYIDVAGATNIPLFVMQPKLAVGYWQLHALREILSRGGSALTVRILPDVRDRFFFRPDAFPVEQKLAQDLPGLIHTAMTLLKPAQAARSATPLPMQTETRVETSRRGLVEYRADPQPPLLELADRDGTRHSLQHFKGQVVVVNFWASWCPPCVREMPSMQALREKMSGKPFTLLGINMAETTAVVDTFMRDHKLDFPVWMDRDGTALTRWKVMAFPTSFVIDKTGHIRYGVFGGIDWTEADTLKIIGALIEEP